MQLRSAFLFVVTAISLAALGIPKPAPSAEAHDAFYYNKLLGRGINLGNALEAPKEGEWGVTLKEPYFEAIKKAGFNSVRIPIRWSAHADATAPCTIEPAFMARVDWAVDQALKRDLVAVINVHHFEEMFQDPDATTPRLVGLWKQIAEHFRGRPDRLYFELLNEPHEKLTDEKWNAIVPQLLSVIREKNPHRIVITGPSQWNSPDHLPSLQLPENDRMLIATFHYYSPFEFTHQGAEFQPGAEKWLGTKWTGSPAEMAALQKDFGKVAEWSKQHNRPVLLGEFGAYHRADMHSRVAWTNAVCREAEKDGFSWSYWEFCSGFGAYDPETDKWREPLLAALVPVGRRAER